MVWTDQQLSCLLVRPNSDTQLCYLMDNFAIAPRHQAGCGLMGGLKTVDRNYAATCRGSAVTYVTTLAFSSWSQQDVTTD